MKPVTPLIACLLLMSCDAWEKNVERGGYAFSRYRQDAQTGVHLGVLSAQAAVDGFTCAKGDWAHFNDDWYLQLCKLAAPYQLGPVTLAPQTWVMPRTDRLIVAFAQDTACQGYICRGTGGSKGAQTVFDGAGGLRAFFARTDTEVDGVTCNGSAFDTIQLYPGGALQSCVAARPVTIGESTFARGDRVTLDAAGQPL